MDMDENVFKRETADQLTNRIADRLGERQQKLEQMAEWERTSSKPKVKPLYYFSAIAACVVVVVLLWPASELSPIEELGIDVPTMTEYRAASPDVTRIGELIEKEKYAEALVLTEKVLINSDKVIEELGSIPEMWDNEEEMLYEDELERVKNSELRWTYIYLLVQLGRNKEACKELKTYLKEPQYCEHEEEAKRLLEKLKK